MEKQKSKEYLGEVYSVDYIFHTLTKKLLFAISDLQQEVISSSEAMKKISEALDEAKDRIIYECNPTRDY